MELAHIDLNLLVVFQQLLQDRQVSRAAAALGLSQPAVSHALRRLRALLGDELFVRTAQGMEPTAFALQLAEPVGQALATLHRALNSAAVFDPVQSTRTFTLAMTDVGEIYFLPVLMEALAREAPGVTLRVVPAGGEALAQAMTEGRVDLALGLLPQLQAGFFQQALFRQGYVCLLRQRHPLARKAALSQQDFLSAGHVRVDAPGTGHSRVDAYFERAGWVRQIRLAVPHYVALGHVLASTDLLATVPERFAQRAAAPLGLAIRPLPLEAPATAIHQFWHARLHREAGTQWLRQRITAWFGRESDELAME